jgi:zinc protease
MSKTIKKVLPNGLIVLVTETNASPVVAINLWVRAGYFDEDEREIGISHVIEHMFFKGTVERPRPDQIAVEIKGLGGDLNAGTYYDSTNYYVVLPAANFRKGLEIQADALMHPSFDAGELGREIEAVLQEARRKIDTPSAYAMEMMYAEAFRTHRIRRWRIGTEEGLRAMTRDDLLAYYRTHYVPGRVILSIVGDVDAPQAIEAAHLYLGGMEAAEGASLGSPAESPERAFRYRRLTGDIARSHLVVGFHAAPALSDDDMALRILAHLLGSGRSSRLYQAVKEREGLVDSIGMGLQSFQDIGVMAVVAGCDPGKARGALGAIQAELEGLRREPPTAGEIERARTAIEFQHHQSRSEVLGQSAILAYYEAMGGFALADEVVERLRRVSAKDVRKAAEKYLAIDGATILEYVPDGAKVDEIDPAALNDELRRVDPGAPPSVEAAARGVPAAAAPGTVPQVVPGEAAGQVSRHRFDSGPLLLLEENHDLPLVSFCVAFRGGRSGEGRDKCGITRLMQSSMVKGTPRREADQLAIEVDVLGTSIERLIDEDYFGFAMTVLSKHARHAFEILMDVVRHPAFRHEEIDKERRLMLTAQEAIKDQSLPYTFQLFRRAAFGSHPYALPTFGLEAPVQALKREDLVKWHRHSVLPTAMVISAVGDITAEDAVDLVGTGIAEWSHEGRGGKDPGQVLAWGAAEAIESRRRQQTAQIVGFPTPGLLSPERFALDLVQAITSGLGGRFFEEVRGKRGLAYAVHAFNYHRVSGGAFAVYLATSPGDEAEARKVLFREIAHLRQDGPRREEIERAVRYLHGRHSIALQGNVSRAVRYVDAEVRGPGVEGVLDYPERIAAVGGEDVSDAIWRYLDPDHCAMGVLRGEPQKP